MKTIPFTQVFTYRNSNLGEAYYSDNIELLNKNFCLPIKKCLHVYTNESQPNNFKFLIDAVDYRIDRPIHIQIPYELYYLNSNLATVHPTYQVLMDEMKTKTDIRYVIHIDEHKFVRLRIGLTDSAYWLCGDAYTFTMTIENFKLIDSQ